MTISSAAKEIGFKSLFAYASGITTPSAVIGSEIARRVTGGALRGIGNFTANLFGINGNLIARTQNQSGFLNNIKYYVGLSTFLAINIGSGIMSMKASNAIGQAYDPNYHFASFGLKCLIGCTVMNIVAYNLGLPQTSAGINLHPQTTSPASK